MDLVFINLILFCVLGIIYAINLFYPKLFAEKTLNNISYFVLIVIIIIWIIIIAKGII